MTLRIFFLLLLSLPFVTFGQDSDVKIGSVWFKGKSTRLTKAARTTMDSFIIQLKDNPIINVRAVSYNKDFCDKCDVRSWDRIKAVFTYLSKHGISSDRLLSTNRLEGELNKVDLFFTSESIKNITPKPGIRKMKTPTI